MSNSLLCHFNEDKNSNTFTGELYEEWNIEEDLLFEGTTIQIAQNSSAIFDNAPKHAPSIQRNCRNKLNTKSFQKFNSVKPICQNRSKSEKYSYNSDSNENEYKPSSLKEEIRMLLQMLALKNKNRSSNHITDNLKDDEPKHEAVTMRDIESSS